MMETTYFEEPDLKVTASKVMTPKGVFPTDNIVAITFNGLTQLWWHCARYILGYWAIIGCLVFTGALPGKDSIWLVPYLFIFMALTPFLIRPSFKVKVKLLSGLVEFDCGGNLTYARELANALGKVVRLKGRAYPMNQEWLNGQH
ncbi:MAG: hypothetical protein ABI670_09720 [Chloroflexota bacterium]